jgi:hypothetical protein
MPNHSGLLQQPFTANPKLFAINNESAGLRTGLRSLAGQRPISVANLLYNSVIQAVYP